MKPIIEIDQLRKAFRRVQAVDGLSLQVPEGAVTAFLGPNGAGKSTTIKCLLNLLDADAGESSLLGCRSKDLGPEQFRQIGYVSENQQMPDWMNVAQLLDYLRPMYPEWDRDFEKKLLADFELPMSTALRSLSRGQRMKAALLSSLAYRPKLVILDEPFSGLDPLVRDEFLHGLLELTEREGWTTLISSHDIEEVERLADRVAIIDRGRIQLDETAESLLERFRSIEVQLADDSTKPADLPRHWIHLQHAGRSVRYVDPEFDGERQQEIVSVHFPRAVHHEARAMTLREIFVALARTYRLTAHPAQS